MGSKVDPYEFLVEAHRYGTVHSYAGFDPQSHSPQRSVPAPSVVVLMHTHGIFNHYTT
jgi:hypothetical protein